MKTTAKVLRCLLFIRLCNVCLRILQAIPSHKKPNNSNVIVNIRVRVKYNFDFVFKLVIVAFMYVITFANPKGGSGKTTSAILLAEQIALSGGRVSVLDLDPNANILAWAESRKTEGRDVPFSVHARPQAEDTVELIDQLADEADYLIIDLEGSKDQVVTFALSRTDLCVIPLDGSPMEARQAAAAVRLVQTTSNMIRSPIEYALLFTRTNAAFQTTDERDVRQEMDINNIPTLPVRIAKRAPFTRIFRDGVLLAELPGIVEEEQKGKSASATDKAMKQVSSAIENARDYAQAVIHALTNKRAA
ncbi:ParA family protein [Marinobacter sp.]|uniref:ParA family protein n=1 Tax=Marinobacter sp. TaxID=50741 RepID=UPI002B4A4D8B|nr:ParA family protein [Marinobacter sp.]